MKICTLKGFVYSIDEYSTQYMMHRLSTKMLKKDEEIGCFSYAFSKYVLKKVYYYINIITAN